MGSLWLVGNEEFSKRKSKISVPSVGVFWANEPLAVMSSLRADSMPKPERKMFNDTSSGRDRSGLVAKKRKNLAQAAPMDSSSDCLKSRISIGREFMHLSRENEWQKSAQSSFQSPHILPIMRVYHCSALSLREKGNNFHRKASYVMPGITKLEHSSSNTFKWSHGSSLIVPEKGRFRTMALKVGRGSPLAKRSGFDENDGFQNSPLG